MCYKTTFPPQMNNTQPQENYKSERKPNKTTINLKQKKSFCLISILNCCKVQKKNIFFFRKLKYSNKESKETKEVSQSKHTVSTITFIKPATNPLLFASCALHPTQNDNNQQASICNALTSTAFSGVNAPGQWTTFNVRKYTLNKGNDYDDESDSCTAHICIHVLHIYLQLCAVQCSAVCEYTGRWNPKPLIWNSFVVQLQSA